MRRRALLRFGVGSGLVASLGARADPVATPHIGVLSLQDPEPFLGGFRAGLKELGYVEGRNVRVDLLTADGSVERLETLAGELVRRDYDVIATIRNAAAAVASAPPRASRSC